MNVVRKTCEGKHTLFVGQIAKKCTKCEVEKKCFEDTRRALPVLR